MEWCSRLYGLLTVWYKTYRTKINHRTTPFCGLS
ncbi:hypothetical protein CoNPh32_CDS0025 [Staphylococcus phage S-CoN_Ph32]|nr:hypothetical protein CoNPh32_CDS0025 [Staphylococcus phage S-CoN_Ph32]